MTQIAELLAESLHAHTEYRHECKRALTDANGNYLGIHEGNELNAGEWMTKACRARVEAMALDPERADPAWKDHPLHDDLLTFYAEQLSR